MKKLIYINLGLILLFSSCNIIDPLGDELEKLNSNIEQEISYTLTDDDFELIASRALYLNPNDTDNVEFLGNYRFFTNEVQAASYVPMLLDNLFPLGSGSQAKVSYNFNGQMPEELILYSDALVFGFTSAEYGLVSEATQAAGYFSPLYSPEKHIPGILKEKLDTAVSGDFYKINYKYADVTPEIDYSAFEINPEWQSAFVEDLSEFQLINVKGVQTWNWTLADEGSAAINGWDNEYFENEDWLITPEINLSNVSNTHLSLTHGVEYFSEESLFILISTDFDGEDVEKATWTEIPFPNYEDTDKNNYIETDAIDVTAFDGEKIHLAFKYISTSDKAPYWGIGNVKIGPYGYKTIGATPVTYNDFYEFDGSNWSKMIDANTVNSADFKILGLSNNYFTAADPASDYLPKYAAQQFPYATEGKVVTFVFDYLDENNMLTLADQLTLTDGVWISTYDFVKEVTEPYASTVDGWVFDPTVNFTMAKEDYSTIAYFVKADPVLSELDNNTFEDSEYYYGASTYYQNFDTRSGKFYSVFATWEEAVSEAIGSVLLPIKYPEATTQYKGIDMFYVVHFLTYGAPSANYYMIFQCTKSAPDPEFTLVEGPIAE